MSNAMTRKHPDNPLLGPRDAFITQNLRLVHMCAKRYAYNRGYDDVVSEGTIGLILAYDRYSDATVAFSTFAATYIRGYIRNYFRSLRGTVSVPRRTLDNSRRIAEAGLEDKAPETVAEALGITVKHAESALYYLAVTESGSRDYDEEINAKSVHTFDDDTVSDVNAFIERQVPKNQRLLRLLMDEYTQTEAAEKLGVSRQAASQAIKRMRGKCVDEFGISA